MKITVDCKCGRTHTSEWTRDGWTPWDPPCFLAPHGPCQVVSVDGVVRGGLP